MVYDLEFEKPLAELEKKIADLQGTDESLNADDQALVRTLVYELHQCTRDIYNNLSSWQTVQVARHKDRPYAADYIRLMFDDFFELHGDRTFADDHAIIAGFALLGGKTVMLVCQQKGRGTREKIFRNSGMPHPEGYRKANRLMRQAEKFGIPIVTFIDTAGASITVEDEERGQSTSIAENLYLMAELQTPIVSVVIGEGGSGGALAISIADRILMLEYAIYTVAAPEAAASILYRDTAFASEAANAMRISARELKAINLIDELIPEPLGGAHRNYQQAADSLKTVLLRHIEDLYQYSTKNLLQQRHQRFRHIGVFDFAS